VLDTRLIRQATAWLMVVTVLAILFLIVKPFLAPLTWAAVLAIFFFPVHGLVRRGIPRPNLASLATVCLVTLLLVLPVISLAPTLTGQTISMLSSLSAGEFLPKARLFFEESLKRSPVPIGDIQEVIDEISRKARAVLAQQSARLAGDLARSLFELVVMLLAMFYLFRDGERVVELLRDLSPWTGEHRDRIMGQVTELVQVTISSSFAVAAVQGLLGGLVFWVVGMPSPMFWGALMALMAFLPVVGPWLVWGPSAIGLFLAGQTGRGIALVILGLVVVSGADNVLRPVLIAGRSQLNGLLVFISVLGGIRALGFLGVVLGPLVVATAVGLLKGYHESLRREAESNAPSRPG